MTHRSPILDTYMSASTLERSPSRTQSPSTNARKTVASNRTSPAFSDIRLASLGLDHTIIVRPAHLPSVPQSLPPPVIVRLMIRDQYPLRSLAGRVSHPPAPVRAIVASKTAETRRRRKEERTRRSIAYHAWSQTPKGQIGANDDLLLRLLEFMTIGDRYRLALAHPTFTQSALDFVWQKPPCLLLLFALLPKRVATVIPSDCSLVSLSAYCE